MKTVFAVIFCLSLMEWGMTQTIDNNNSYQIEAYDVRGKALTARKPNVKGTPLVTDQWAKALVVFSDGKRVNMPEVQFNLQTNELSFSRDGVGYLFAAPVKEFFLSYTENEQSYTRHFRNGYPPEGKYDEARFYEVLSIGSRFHFLKVNQKSLLEEPVYVEGTKKVYKDFETLYLFDVDRKATFRIRKELRSIVKAIPDKEKELQQYVKENNASIKTEEDIIALVKWLNK